jgi:diguanylate cyclase (GGDEF)-like protein/PAS domain S-box-containing protein
MRKETRLALRLALIYAAFGILWISLSDRFLASVITDSTTLTQFQTFKGSFYVVITAALVFYLMQHALKQQFLIEEKLRESEERWKFALEGAGDGVWDWNPKTDEALFSNYWKEMIGYTEHEFPNTGAAWVEHLHPDDKDRVLSAVQDYFHGNRPLYVVEFRMRCKDGSWKWILARGMLVSRDVDGSPLRLIGTHTDITERKQVESELRLERDRNLMYLNTVQTLMVALNAEGSISMINRAGCELLGYKESELFGRNWFETCLPQPEGMNIIYPMFKKIMRGDLSTDEYYENSVLCRDGTLRLIAWNNACISDDASHNIGTLSSGQDITTRKLAETALRESEDRFRIIFANAIDGILLVDAETREFVMANPSIARMLGYDSEEILRIGVDDIHPVEALPDIVAGFNRQLTGEITPVPDLPVKRKDGSVFYADINPVPVTVKGKAYMLATFRDITERKRTEDVRRQAATVFESSHDGAVITDLTGRILAVNRAYQEITGYSEAELLGQNPSMLHSGLQNKAFYQSMWASLKEAGYWRGELWNRCKNGEIYPERITISAVKNASGETTHYVGMSSDLSQLKQSETQLEHLAHYDPLTDMPNRLLVQSHLTHTLAQAQRLGRQVGVLYLDLDRFKSINESLGYLVGDELLVNLTKRLTSRLRGGDMLARLGGDEFLLVMEHMEGPEDVAGVARSLLELLTQSFVLSGEQEVFIGASIGISVFPNDGNSANQLIQHADAAMHQAKKQGRNTYSFYTDSLTRAAGEHFELETRLRHAITANQLRVYYQPQVDIATGHIIGAEALVRWLDPERGLIPPVHFIPLAEETGLINAIGEWVLRETCLQGMRWIKAGLPFLTLAVNLSPHQFMRGNIAELVSKVLAETGFPAGRLELELTESALMEQEEAAVKMLHLLRAQDIRLAIDDFGTGYSSLAYLKRFPLDILKIDKSFVDDIPFHQDDMEIAATIIAMGHTLGFKVLAEGVETAEQLAFLQAKGCDMYQGYLTSPAVPAEEFEKLLKKK